MQKLIARAWASQFFRYNVLAFTGGVGVAALNYLYYPVLGRFMVPADFGEVQAINSLLVQVVIFLSVFNIVTVGVVARYKEADQQNRLIAELQKVAAIIAAGAILVLLIMSPQLATFFQFHSVLPFVALLAAIALSVPGAFRNAYLNGQRDFAATARGGVIAAGGKLVFGLLLVLIGWRAFGAVAGMVIAQALSLWYVTTAVRKHGWRRPDSFHWPAKPNFALIRPELKFAGLVLVTTFSLNLFLTINILAAKHWFDPHTAGLYAGIDTLSRIVFFMNASVAAVLLPSVSPRQSPAENRGFLYRSLALTCALGLSVLAAFTIAPRFFVELLMGNTFLPYARLLPRLAAFTFLASVINLLVNYYLAQQRAFIAIASTIGLAGIFTLLMLNHATPAALVDSLLAGSVLMIVSIGLCRTFLALRTKNSS